MRRLWRSKWNLVRLAIAAFLLWIVAADTPARLARLQLAELPGFDYAGEVRYLRSAGRYGEALMAADAGLEESSKRKAQSSNEDKDRRAELEEERRLTAQEQGSYLRRARDVGMGAVTGGGGSLESLVGAIAADFFVVGDVRDLVIQGGKLALDGETDEVILALSGVGLVTTLAPHVDWVPSVLKAAKRAGTMTRGLGQFIVDAAKAGEFNILEDLMTDVAAIARRASPGGAARMLKHADSPADVAKLARFVEAEKAGAFALHVTGGSGAAIVKAGAGAEKAVVMAAAKGDHGIAWLRAGGYRALLRPHPIIGLAKGVYKGNVQDAINRALEEIGPGAWWVIPLLAAWLFVEIGLLLRGRPTGAPSSAVSR